MINQYQIASKLGEGAFASVYKVTRKQDKSEYALKRIKISSLSEKEIENCLNEVRILSSVQSPNIVAYKDSFYDQMSNSFCIVTEFLQGGDLSRYIKKMKGMKGAVSENKIWSVALQMLRALKTLHNNNILHRDIKPANILLSKDCKAFKLADMNVSKIVETGMAQTQTGTPYYASPEVWRKKPYTSKCDIWSLGCVLYELTTFRPPFMAENLHGLKKSIAKGQFKPIPVCYSQQLSSFIEKCLRVDSQMRFSAEELLQSTELAEARFWKLEVDISQICEELKDGASKVQLHKKMIPPKKKDFFRIRQQLPRSKFSLQSSKDIRKGSDSENKQNLCNQANNGSVKIGRKDQLPPMIKRSASLSNRNQKHIRFLQERVVNLCEEAIAPSLARRIR